MEGELETEEAGRSKETFIRKRTINDALQAPKSKVHRTVAQGWNTLQDGSSIIGYWSQRISNSDEVLKVLMNEAPWKQTEVIMFGKPVMQPRKICYMADSKHFGYKYSGAVMVVEPWHESVLPLKSKAEEMTGYQFNSCLLNLYRDGQDYVGWHSDDEAVYEKGAPICSVSLGATRKFQMRLKTSGTKFEADRVKDSLLEWDLGKGDIFVMKGSTQEHWQHRIHKEGKRNNPGPRISLTFRKVRYPSKLLGS